MLLIFKLVNKKINNKKWVCGREKTTTQAGGLLY